jgi:hypothetical protein
MRKLMASTAAVALLAGVGAGGALAATGHPDPSSSRDRVSHVGHREHSSAQDRSHSRTDRASRDREASSRSR